MSKKKFFSGNEKQGSFLKLEPVRVDNKSFDFPCLNDYCPGRNGCRANGIAWKIDETAYTTFCHLCGQNMHFSKEEFRIKKEQITSESKKKDNESNIDEILRLAV